MSFMLSSPRRSCAILLALVAAVALVGVAVAQPASPVPLITLHTFTGGDGSGPNTQLLLVGDDLYGTTADRGPFGWGTIFRISRTGTFQTVYSFLGLGDGAGAQQLVLGPDGAIYGTTSELLFSDSRAPIHGTFYRIAPSGALTTLYVFSRLIDGYGPNGWLTLGTDGYFYGTTRGGGTSGFGTAFRLDTRGQLTVLHAFDGIANQISGPLVQGDDGNLYGAASVGIEKLTLSGDLSLVQQVGVWSSLLMKGRDGRIYGSTVNNGAPSCDPGTVFSLSPSGDFRNGPPGPGPCGLFFVNFQAPDLSLFGTYTTQVTTVVRLTPAGVISDPGAYPVAPINFLTDGGDGWMYGVNRVGLGAVVKMPMQPTPTPPTNVRIKRGSDNTRDDTMPKVDRIECPLCHLASTLCTMDDLSERVWRSTGSHG
jgi:uncharacterized repeat protein (TIGR03803 family)